MRRVSIAPRSPQTGTMTREVTRFVTSETPRFFKGASTLRATTRFPRRPTSPMRFERPGTSARRLLLGIWAHGIVRAASGGIILTPVAVLAAHGRAQRGSVSTTSEVIAVQAWLTWITRQRSWPRARRRGRVVDDRGAGAAVPRASHRARAESSLHGFASARAIHVIATDAVRPRVNVGAGIARHGRGRERRALKRPRSGKALWTFGRIGLWALKSMTPLFLRSIAPWGRPLA
jgi:hypothetical protein